MDGSMALINTINAASGARRTDTRHTTAHVSINAYSAIESGTGKSNATSHIKGAEPDESSVSPTTTLEWLTLTVPQTLGPSDSRKDFNKGVMS
jgi:hypothetical protein